VLVSEMLTLYRWGRWKWQESWRFHSWNAWHRIRSFETPKSTCKSTECHTPEEVNIHRKFIISKVQTITVIIKS